MSEGLSDWVAFEDLMSRPDVDALAQRMWGAGGTPQFMARFLALTWTCAAAMPQQSLQEESAEMAVSGCCVFYAPEGDDRHWEPWTCSIYLGASAHFTFEKVGDYTRTLSEDDSWDSTGQLGWQAKTMELLRNSLWRPLNNPAALGR